MADNERFNRSEVAILLRRISQDYQQLSPGLQRIALYIEKNFYQLAFENIEHVARMCEIQPSAVVRFAKHFGYKGYSEMRRVFRLGMNAQISYQRNYQARIRDLIGHTDTRLSMGSITQSHLEGAILEMQALKEQLQHSKDLHAAVRLLVKAPTLWVVGSNRAFPVATYLVYLLKHTDKPVHLATNMGTMFSADIRALQTNDVMVAISFAPYGKETLDATEVARSKGVKIISITDSTLNPLGRLADISLVVTESSVFGFRSLTNTMVIAQSLFVALAYEMEIQLSSH